MIFDPGKLHCTFLTGRISTVTFIEGGLALYLSQNDKFSNIYRGRISSVGRVFDCGAGGRGFDSRGRTNTQGLKITEK